MLLPVFVPLLVSCFHPFAASKPRQGFIIQGKSSVGIYSTFFLWYPHTVVSLVFQAEIVMTFFSTQKEFRFLYLAAAMLFLFIAFLLLTCNKPSKSVCLHLPFLFQSSCGSTLSPWLHSPRNNEHPNSPPRALCPHQCPSYVTAAATVLKWPPPPYFLLSPTLSNVSEVTAIFSGS